MNAFDENSVEQPKTTEELLAELLANQQHHREEVAALRAEVAAKQTPLPAAPATAQSPEELQAARVEEIKQHPYYCPGCGRLHDYLHECTGRPEAPHPPILVVDTKELLGDPVGHTAAPNTDKLG